jgi:ATP-dependent RNA helicase DDX10/DBP4
MLMPTEEAHAVKGLEDAGVPVKKLTVNPKKTVSVAAKAAALLAAQPEYRAFAKKAFTGYLRSVQLLPGLASLDVSQLPVEEFAASLGLGITPDVPVVEKGAAGREDVRSAKNVNRSLDKLKKQIKEAKEAKKAERDAAKLSKTASKTASARRAADSDDEDLLSSRKKPSKKDAKKKKKVRENVDEEGEDDEDDLLTVKQVHAWGPDISTKQPSVVVAAEDSVGKKRDKDSKLKINMDGEVRGVKEKTGGLKKTVFDDEGNAVDPTANRFKTTDGSAADSPSQVDERIASYASLVKERVDRGRRDDLAREKQRIREKRLKLKKAADGDSDGEEEEGEDGGDFENAPRLANFEPEQASDDEDEDQDSTNDGSDSEASSDDQSGSDEEPSATTRAIRPVAGSHKKNQQQQSKRKRGGSDSDSSHSESHSDSDNSGDETPAMRNKRLKQQEEQVLQMMNKK